MALPKKKQDILGKCYSVFGCRQAPLGEIAMYRFIKTDAVEKARKRVLGHLQKLPRENPNPWAAAEATIHSARRESERAEDYSTPQGAWYEDEWELKERFPEFIRALIAAFTIMWEALEEDPARQPTAQPESHVPWPAHRTAKIGITSLYACVFSVAAADRSYRHILSADFRFNIDSYEQVKADDLFWLDNLLSYANAFISITTAFWKNPEINMLLSLLHIWVCAVIDMFPKMCMINGK